MEKIRLRYSNNPNNVHVYEAIKVGETRFFDLVNKIKDHLLEQERIHAKGDGYTLNAMEAFQFVEEEAQTPEEYALGIFTVGKWVGAKEFAERSGGKQRSIQATDVMDKFADFIKDKLREKNGKNQDNTEQGPEDRGSA